jgi:hypothetical protein
MIEELKRLVSAVETIPEEVEGLLPDVLTDALIDAKKAIAEAEKQDGWVLREVLFSNGEPIAHREAEKQTSVSEVEPVAWMQDSIELYVQDRPSEYYKIPLYTHPYASQPKREPVAIAWAAFTEACQRVSSPEQSDDLRDAIDRMTDALMERDERAVTPDYVQGHKDGCEWSSRLAEASDPRTGDWLYDDPYELAKALRKGPDFGNLNTTPQPKHSEEL